MANVAVALEAAGATAGGAAAIAAVLWRPMVDRHDRRRDQKDADDLLMHGSRAVPGVKAVPPAGVRLTAVEVGLSVANHKLDDIADAVTALVAVLTEVAGELKKNHGSSLRDAVDRLEDAAGTKPE